MESIEIQRRERNGCKADYLSDQHGCIDNSLHPVVARDNNRSLFAFAHRWFIFPFRFNQVERVLDVDKR